MQSDLQRRLIFCYARDEDFLPLTRPVLAKMGYALVTPEEQPNLPARLAAAEPELYIVEEQRLLEVSPTVSCPIILLIGRAGVSGSDPRVLGAVRRPAGPHELYRLLQQGLEETPRTAPRVATNLRVQCRQSDREWRASLVSLSENGCLLRTPDRPALGSVMDLCFELPQGEFVETRAEAAYQLMPDVGLVFQRLSVSCREAIARFVQSTMVTSHP